MNKEELMARSNAKLQHLVETVLDYVVLITDGDTVKFEAFRKVLLNKYNALKKANIQDFNEWSDKDHE